MTTHSEKAVKPQLVPLLLISSFGSIGATLFTPALPAIQAFFRLSVDQAQLSITVYLFGYALGQLIYGPVANRFGRKPALFLGISIAIVGALLCAFSAYFESFSLLIFGRVLQALGACAGIKICFTMIADAYNQQEATRIISHTIMAFAIIPGVGIAIGGWITHLINWQSCFYFLALFGVLVMGISTKLPETAKSLDRHALKLRSVIQGYGMKLKNHRLIISALMMGCGTAVIYIFATKAPFIGISTIGMTPNTFGNFNLIPSAGIITGSILASRLSERVPLLKLLFSGIIGSIAATLTMFIPFALEMPNIWSLFLPMFLIYAAEAIVFANSSAFGLATAKNKSNASAMMNFINIGTAFIAVLLAEFIYPEAAMLLPISFIFFFLVMLLLWLRLRKIGLKSV